MSVLPLGRALVVGAIVMFVGGACGGAGPKASFEQGTFRRGDERFQVKALPSTWRRVDARAGDLAWTDPATDAVIAANATCRGHKDSPLPTLMNDLLLGTTRRRYLLEEDLYLSGRAALHNVVEADLDGVPMVYDLYVLKKDGCVYDLWLVVPPGSYDRVADHYVSFVDGFRALGENLQ